MGILGKFFKGNQNKTFKQAEETLNAEEILNIVADKMPNARIEYYYEIKDKIRNWSDREKALLYRWIGKACDAGLADKEYRNSTVYLSFYAASLALDSRYERDCWVPFDIKYGFPASQQNADKLHAYYPLPETLEEARNYKVEALYNK